MLKAISQILALILLIAFVITLSIIIWTFMGGVTLTLTKQTEEKGKTTLSCAYTALEIARVIAQHPEVILQVKQDGMNKLTGLFAEVIMNDSSYVKQYYEESLGPADIKEFIVENVDKPFVQVRFWGAACPGWYAEKRYDYRENSLSGSVGSKVTASIENSGDVDVRPTLIIERV